MKKCATDKLIGNFYTTESFSTLGFPYTLPVDTDSATVKIVLDNDYADPGQGTDRNTFIRKIRFTKQ